MSAYEIIVSGKVQGVGFRMNTKQFALKKNLIGFVKNLSDGSVQIKLRGNEDNLKKLKDFIKNEPGWSIVKKIDVEEIDDTDIDDFNSFVIC